MRKFLLLGAFLLFTSVCVAGQTVARPEVPAVIGGNEKLVLNALKAIRDAEYTFSATAGNRSFGSLFDLHHLDLIDKELASGTKYDYIFNLFYSAHPQKPSEFYIIAIPRQYPISGRLSFYIPTDGDVHAADKKGRAAGPADPMIDACSSGTIDENERCIYDVLRTLYGAQMTYASQHGNRTYGSIERLAAAELVPKSYRSGSRHGYSIKIRTFASSTEWPAEFKVYAEPKKYGVTGIRSFFIGLDGVTRGADKNGKPADENDIYAIACSKCSAAENERAAIEALSSFQGAQQSYFLRDGNSKYATLEVLREENLLDKHLLTGMAYGYKFDVTVVVTTPYQPPAYGVCAVPMEYPKKGVRSFFIDENGVVRGADKKGMCADQNDPSIEN